MAITIQPKATQTAAVPPKKTGRNASKVKTGCRTCKGRKIKCDEARPHCKKCVSAGRQCGGYGVWDAPPAKIMLQQQQSTTTTPMAKSSPAAPMETGALATISVDELGYFEWFTCRAASKLQGTSKTGFWEKLVFQASYTDRAVLDAVLALGSAHRGHASLSRRAELCDLDGNERFMLKHYNSSIAKLAGSFLVQGRDATKIALVACVVFVCLESIRGHYRSACTHLRHGLKLLGQMGEVEQETEAGWMSEAINRLGLQAALLGLEGCLPPRPTTARAMPNLFSDALEARLHLDRLLAEAVELSQATDQTTLDSHFTPELLIIRQKTLQTNLQTWLTTFHASETTLSTTQPIPIIHTITTHNLKSYHALATILCQTSLISAESAYDAHTPLFRSIISHSAAIYNIVIATRSIARTPMALRDDVPHFVADKGWIAPLYFTAVKCRVSEVRKAAVEMLGMHEETREGVWDARVAGVVGREVVRLEEEGDEGLDDLRVSEEGGVGVPEERRLRDVQVLLPDAPDDVIGLVCKRRNVFGVEEWIMRKYCPILKRWSDIELTGPLVFMSLEDKHRYPESGTIRDSPITDCEAARPQTITPSEHDSVTESWRGKDIAETVDTSCSIADAWACI